jgi:hypothetical protein
MTIYEYSLNHMRFSNCGNFLHGVRLGHPRAGEPVFLHLGPQLSCVPLVISNVSEANTAMMHRTTRTTANEVIRSDNRNISMTNTDRQTSGIPEFTTCRGQLQVSARSQDRDARSVMLQTMRADGKMIEETITRLPQSPTLEQSYSTLVPADNHQNLRLVLNMAIQDTYSIDDKPDFRLPAVLDRKKESIPRTIYIPQRALEATANLGKRSIEGISEDVVRREAEYKRRR